MLRECIQLQNTLQTKRLHPISHETFVFLHTVVSCTMGSMTVCTWSSVACKD